MGKFVKCLGVLGFMAMAVLMIVGIVEARMLEKEAFELEFGGGGANRFGLSARAGGAAPGPGLGAGGFGFGGRAGGAAPGPGLGAGVGGAGHGFGIGGGF